MNAVEITFLGHVGLFVESRHGSVLCDPWFTPAYFGSWFPFPRNDDLDRQRISSPDYLYISHLHRDHFDPEFLATVDKRAQVLLPDFSVPYLERELAALGFSRFVRTTNGEVVDLDGLEVAIFAMNQPADGPLGDSAIVIADGDARVINQNDARPGALAGLQELGPTTRSSCSSRARSGTPLRTTSHRPNATASPVRSATTRCTGRASTSSGSTPRTCSRVPGRPASSTTNCGR